MSDKSTKQACPVMTTSSGRPVGDNQNSITAGPRGPVLMEDHLLFEKMAHFNRERICRPRTKRALFEILPMA